MGDDRPEVLNLLHESGRRWTTLRAEGEEWVDEDRSREAFLHSVPPGAVVTARGTPGPPDRDPVWKVWARQPHQWRADLGGPHRTRFVLMGDGARACTSYPSGGYRITERRVEPAFGPAALLLRPASLLAALDVEVIGRATFLGREVFHVRGRPRTGGADDVEFAVDADRGILLWLAARFDGAPYRRITMSTVAFDEDLDDALFAMPDGAQASRHPAHGDGPPDAALGVPVGRPVVVARAPSLVIAVDRVVAYPTGFELGLTVRTQEQPVHGSFDQSHRRTWSGTSAFPGESLRVEVVAGAPVALRAISGSGTQTRFDQRYWVAPLPPPGPVGIVVAWPRRGLAETRADLDGAAIAEAGGRAEELWP